MRFRTTAKLISIVSIVFIFIFIFVPQSNKRSNHDSFKEINITHNQIFQQEDGYATIPLEFDSKIKCLIDGKKVEPFSYQRITIGKHTISCEGSFGKKVSDFFVGDVFFVMGQSNAEGFAENSGLTPNIVKNVVFFDMSRNIYSNNQNTESKKRGSAWTSFANTYSKKAGVPVGIILATRITPIESYSAGKFEPGIGRDYFYYSLVNTINSFGKYKGIIWYHGESAGASMETAQRYSNDLNSFFDYIDNDTNKKTHII